MAACLLRHSGLKLGVDCAESTSELDVSLDSALADVDTLPFLNELEEIASEEDIEIPLTKGSGDNGKDDNTGEQTGGVVIDFCFFVRDSGEALERSRLARLRGSPWGI